MSKSKKEPSAYFCPDCNGDRVLVRGEMLYHANGCDLWCETVKPWDSDAHANCQDCEWKGFRRDLIDKSEEIEAAEKLKRDKEYQRYLKLKSKYEGKEQQ